MFHGPPGTGKSYMASVMAGELGFPMITFTAKDLYVSNPFRNMNRLMSFVRRYDNCIIFIDEADKLFGTNYYNNENEIISEFQRMIEGVDNKEIKALIILAANDLGKFSASFMERFLEVPFELPSTLEREKFLMSKMASVKIPLSLELLTSHTRGFSFRQIEQFWNELMFHYLENDKIGEDVIGRVAREIRKGEDEVMWG